MRMTSSQMGKEETDTDIRTRQDDGSVPSYDFSSWNPEAPAGLHFLCLLPISSGYEAKYEQSEHQKKIKVSSTHRQQRLNLFKSGKTVGKDTADEKRLRQAASNNDYDAVLEVLDRGVNASCQDEKRRTPLHIAAALGNELIVKVLLDHGADPNRTDILGNTPLHLAACTMAKHVAVVMLLLKAGTNLKALDNSGRTPLSLAKSRLSVLMRDKTSNSVQIKTSIKQVADMMKEYLCRAGLTEDAAQLELLCKQLMSMNTIEEVNEINNLLTDFASLTLQKQSRAVT